MMKPEKIRNLYPPKEKETEEKPVKAEEEKQNKAVEKAKEFLRDNPLKTIVLYFAMMGMLGENLPKNAAMEKQQDRMSQLGEDMVDDSIDMWNEAMNNFPKKEPAKLTPEEKKQVEERAKALAGVLDTFAYMPGMEEASEMTQTDLAAIGAPAIPHLINILDGGAEKEAGDLLVWMGEASEPLLITTLADENESILKKEAVVRVLGEMSAPSQDAVDALTSLIKTGEHEDLQFESSEALVSLGMKENAREILPLVQYKIKNAAKDSLNTKRALRMLVLLGERDMFAQGIADINEANKDNEVHTYDPFMSMSIILFGKEDVEGFVADLFKTNEVRDVLVGISVAVENAPTENHDKLVELSSSLLQSKDENLKLSSLMILEKLGVGEFRGVIEKLSEKEKHELFAYVQTKITEDSSIGFHSQLALMRFLDKGAGGYEEAGLALKEAFEKVKESGSDDLFPLFSGFAELEVAQIEDFSNILKSSESSKEKKLDALIALSHFDISKDEELVRMLRNIYEDKSSGISFSGNAGMLLIRAGQLEQEELKQIVVNDMSDYSLQFQVLVQMVKKGDEGVRFLKSIKSEMSHSAKKTLKAFDRGSVYQKVFGEKG